MECTQEPDFDITGAISVGAWVKLRPSKEGVYVIVSKGERGWIMAAHSAGSVSLHVDVLQHEKYLLGLAKGLIQQNRVYAYPSLKDERWHHVVGTYDGERACLYIDGKLGNSKRIRGYFATNTRPVVIGDNPDWWDVWKWNGLIDDVCIYNYTLTADEVKDLYEGREPPREKKRDSAKTE